MTIAAPTLSLTPAEIRPQQLWLDMSRPIQPRPPGERRMKVGRAAREAPGPQMELRMAALPRQPEKLCHMAAAPAAAEAVRPSHPFSPVDPEPTAERRPCFAAWLLAQNRAGGTIGELARATRADARFPRKGTADDVRAHFGRLGADGDAYAALDDAERAFDRMA